MKPRRYLVPLLLGLLLGAGIWLWQQRQEIAALQLQAKDAERELAQRSTERIELEKRVAEAQAENREFAARLSGPSPAVNFDPLKRSVASSEDGAITDDLVKQWLEDANDPAVLRRLNLQARVQTQRRYDNLFKQLHLTNDQSEALTKLFIDKRLAALDLTVSMVEKNQNPMSDLDGFQALVVTAKSGVEDNIQALLGDSGYAQYQEYDRTFAQANNLAQFGDALRNSDNALTDDQLARLQQAMQNRHTGSLNAKVIADAKEFLSPTQIQVLQDLRQAQQAASQKRNQPQNLPAIGSSPAPARGK